MRLAQAETAFLQTLARDAAEARARVEQLAQRYTRAEQVESQARQALASAERAADPTAIQTARTALQRAEAARAQAALLLERARRQSQRAEQALAKVRAYEERCRTADGSCRTAAGMMTAVVLSYAGQLQIATASNDGAWQDLDPRSAQGLRGDGERLRTGTAGRAELFLGTGENRLVLDAESELALRVEHIRTWIELIRGRLYLVLKKLDKEYQIKTPHAILGVRGTELSVTINRASGRTAVTVLAGRVTIAADEQSKALLELAAGQRAVLRQDGSLEAIDQLDRADYEFWWED